MEINEVSSYWFRMPRMNPKIAPLTYSLGNKRYGSTHAPCETRLPPPPRLTRAVDFRLKTRRSQAA